MCQAGGPCRTFGVFALLEPTGEGLVVDAVDLGKARATQATGLIGLDERGSLFGGIAETPPAVRLQDSFIRSSHNPLRYDCYAMDLRESSNGASGHAYDEARL